jgi:hypothetical protein
MRRHIRNVEKALSWVNPQRVFAWFIGFMVVVLIRSYVAGVFDEKLPQVQFEPTSPVGKLTPRKPAP